MSPDLVEHTFEASIVQVFSITGKERGNGTDQAGHQPGCENGAVASMADVVPRQGIYWHTSVSQIAGSGVGLVRVGLH